MVRIISAADPRKIAARRFRWACPGGATTDLLPHDRMTSAPPLSFPLASRVGRRVGEGIFALPGSRPVVIPTGASPAEIGKHQSYFPSDP